jgi:hypothetical protein
MMSRGRSIPFFVGVVLALVIITITTTITITISTQVEILQLIYSFRVGMPKTLLDE